MSRDGIHRAGTSGGGSSAFDRLLARSAGTLDIARPRLPGRFENGYGSPLDGEESWQEITEERHRSTDRPAEPTLEPDPRQQRPIRARVTWTQPDRIPFSNPEPTLGPPAATPGRDISGEPVTTGDLDQPQPPRPEPSAPAAPKAQPAALAPPEPPTMAARSEPVTTDRGFDRPARGPLPRAETANPATPDRLKPPKAPTLAVPRAIPAPRPEPLKPPEPQRSRVDVRIGRIDVRPAEPRPPAVSSTPLPRARRPRATVSLDDYLRRRGS